MTIQFYSNSTGNQKVKILSENNILLNSIDIEKDKGFNYAEYDLTLTEKGRKSLLKENEALKIERGDDENFYLPKGKYTIQIGEEEKSFEVK